MTIFEAMKKADVKDVTISATKLCDILKDTLTGSDFKFKGATGEMTWDKSGACAKEPQIVELNK